MKQHCQTLVSKPFIVLILVNVFFIVFHVQQYISFFRASCIKQTHERELSDLQARYELVVQELEAIQDRCAIKKYAQSIGLQPIKIKQIRKFPFSKKDNIRSQE